jgi:hypothetical protein
MIKRRDGLRALTVKQPWAWAILFAGKDVENRSWSTKYRGPLLIHAGSSRDRDAVLPRRRGVAEPNEHVLGAILGIVDLLDVVEQSRSRWFSGPFGWILANPRPFHSPVTCPGRLSLWTLTPAEERAVRRRMKELAG